MKKASSRRHQARLLLKIAAQIVAIAVSLDGSDAERLCEDSQRQKQGPPANQLRDQTLEK